MRPTRNRDEHLAWAKERALKYLDDGNLRDAYTSMASDLTKHPDFLEIEKLMSPVGLLHLMNYDARELRRWIEGFR
jgi:hypothetical protein